MTHEEIKTALIEAGYPDNRSLSATVDRLLVLQGEAADMLNAWIKFNVSPTFNYSEQINSQMLYEYLQFKEPAVILAFDMLSRVPGAEEFYLKLLTKNMNFNSQYYK